MDLARHRPLIIFSFRAGALAGLDSFIDTVGLGFIDARTIEFATTTTTKQHTPSSKKSGGRAPRLWSQGHMKARFGSEVIGSSMILLPASLY